MSAPACPSLDALVNGQQDAQARALAIRAAAELGAGPDIVVSVARDLHRFVTGEISVSPDGMRAILGVKFSSDVIGDPAPEPRPLPKGRTLSAAAAVLALGDAGLPVTGHRVADRLGITPQAGNRYLNDLVAQGWIVKRRTGRAACTWTLQDPERIAAAVKRKACDAAGGPLSAPAVDGAGADGLDLDGPSVHAAARRRRPPTVDELVAAIGDGLPEDELVARYGAGVTVALAQAASDARLQRTLRNGAKFWRRAA